MGTISAFKAAEIIKNVRTVLAIEALCAAQGLDFINERPGKGVQAVHRTIRQHVPTLSHDRVMAEDIKKIERLISDETLIRSVKKMIGKLY
jgi:histidine ammonia-lyase